MSFTCITCRVAFNDPELQRMHYKTDWHRYNLKRKVAELPPVTAIIFQEKVLNQKNQAVQIEKRPDNLMCLHCNKRFNSIGAHKNHLQSKKHLETLSKDQSVSSGIKRKNNDESTLKSFENIESELEEDWEECGESIGVEECFFCSKNNINIEENIDHMRIVHSFFIPDVEYICDLEGLVKYLGEKVGEGNMCLWCNKTFHSLTSVQNHMTDKGHTMMLHEGEVLIEYSDYYDYTSSYPDTNDKECEDETNEVEESEINFFDAGFELKLPSGNTIGHRSLMRYFQQKLKPERQLIVKGGQIRKGNIVAGYKKFGWTGTTGDAARKKAKDISFFKRHISKKQMNLSIKANKLQPYFRDHILGT